MSTQNRPTVIPMPGAPVAIPSSFHREPPRPDSPHDHMWVLTAVFAVRAQDVTECIMAWTGGGTPPGLVMDYESLMDTCGPVCLKCNQPLTPATGMLPCPVVLVPILGVAH